MNKILCDHCGVELAARAKHSFSKEFGEKRIHVFDRVVVTLSTKNRYDLCANCYAEMRDFVKDPIEVLADGN